MIPLRLRVTGVQVKSNSIKVQRLDFERFLTLRNLEIHLQNFLSKNVDLRQLFCRINSLTMISVGDKRE